MTPPRLSELKCPHCGASTWVIDSDHRGMGQVSVSYAERVYSCRGCGQRGSGWRVMRQSPPEFLMQPHPMYPMTPKAFAFWVAILKAEFPDHPRLAELGQSFHPRTPDDVRAKEEVYRLAHPVVQMRDQDGTRTKFPEARQALDWLDVMRPNDYVVFACRDGAELHVAGPASGPLTVRRMGPDGAVVAERVDGAPEQVRAEVLAFLEVGSGMPRPGRAAAARNAVARTLAKCRRWIAGR